MHVRALFAFALALTAACSSDPEPGAGGSTSSSSSNLGGAGGTGGGTGGGVTAACPEGYPLSAVAGKPVIEALVDGAGPYSFVFDTGAPTSLLDTSLYTQIGKGPHQLEIAGKVVTAKVMTSYPVQQYLGSTAVSGLLGADVMGQFVVTLDDARSRFWLDDTRGEAALAACAHVNGAPAEVAWVEDDYLFVPGNAEGHAGWFLIDSGASLGAITKSAFEVLQAAHPRPALSGFYTPAAAGTFWAELTSIGYLEVAGLRVEHLLTRTVDDDLVSIPALDGPFLGMLPTGYLRHFLVTLDYPAGKLRLDGYRDLDPREPSQAFSVGIGLVDSSAAPVKIGVVLPGSSAAEKGVVAGDTVVSVSGADFASLSPAERPWLLMAPTQGATMVVEIEHQGVVTSHALEARDLLTDPELP